MTCHYGIVSRCCTKSRHPLWQPAVDVGTGFSRVLYWLLPAPAAASARSMPVWGRRQNPDPGFHHFSAWLLQFAVLGIAHGLMSCLQSVQNAAARLITGVRWCEHITPVLHQLHWLPVCRRVDFNISTLVYHSLAGTAPVYLADECMLVIAAGRCPLRSADSRTCIVNRSCNQFSACCFPTADPTLWNSLPEQLRQTDITF